MRARVVVVCAFVVSLAPLLAARASLEAKIHGEARATETGQLVLRGALEGDVAGTLHVTLRGDGPQAAGHWHLTFETTQDDGTVVETGGLRGAVTGGSVMPGPDGRVVALSNLTLLVTEGSGQHTAVAEGSGRLDVRLGRDIEPFTATLAITF
jgi:hypothetical protein